MNLKAVGTIAEYNPFHRGHAYQLTQAKKITKADVNIVVMSGNWVQRGDPAIVDKWVRTQFALNHGADLVIELPISFATQSVDVFAKGGVNLLANLHCDYLSFGCMHPDLNFTKLAQINLNSERNQFTNYRKPYPKLFQEAFFHKTGLKIHDPNDILGINYARANHNLMHSMKLIPIKRKGVAHGSQQITDKTFASSTAIRNILLQHPDVIAKRLLNQVTFSDILNQIENQKLITWNDFWLMLRFELLTSSLNDLHQIYQMNEGIEYRLKKMAINAPNFGIFIDKVKTKRYTYSRLKRLFLYVLLHWKKCDHIQCDYLRILGFNSLGRDYLNQEKKKIKVPVISKIDRKMLNKFLQLDFKAGMLYGMMTNTLQDLYRHPIIKP